MCLLWAKHLALTIGTENCLDKHSSWNNVFDFIMSGEVFYGWTVRRSKGGRTAKGIVGRRMADSWMFLLFFSITPLLAYVFLLFPLNSLYFPVTCYLTHVLEGKVHK